MIALSVVGVFGALAWSWLVLGEGLGWALPLRRGRGRRRQS